MTALGRALFAALIVTASLSNGAALPACAEGADWAGLARRFAASYPFAALNVALGAEPPGFVFPLNARPALPVLGSTWLLVVAGALPQSVHVYYAPAKQTTAAVDALVAKLTAAGYAQIPDSGFPNGFVGDRGPVHKWCPADLNGPVVETNVEDVGGVPALDVQFSSDARSTSCDRGGALEGRSAGSPVPALGDIPGLAIYPRMRSTETAEDSLGSIAIVRTAMPAAAAVAKLAERFTAKGWTASSPVAGGATILQRFSRVHESRRWNALLLFQARADSDHLYDAVVDVTNAPLGAAER